MKQEPHFKLEADLCSCFIGWVRDTQKGWVVYPETAGWDILLAHADGTQVGIQAKLKLNLAVLSQAVEDRHGYFETGPDFRAVLVPGTEGEMPKLLGALGLNQISSRRRHLMGGKQDFEFVPALMPQRYRVWDTWHYANPEKRHKLPQFVPDVAAGVPGPSSLTEWKIKALRVVAVLELRGWVMRADFRRYDVDHRRWITAGWVVADDKGRYLRGDHLDFDRKHPVIYPQIRAEVAKELPGIDSTELVLK